MIDGLLFRSRADERLPHSRSVEDAVYLAACALPDFEWRVRQNGISGAFTAGVSRYGDVGWTDSRSAGATPALALLRAVATAIALRGGTGGPDDWVWPRDVRDTARAEAGLPPPYPEWEPDSDPAATASLPLIRMAQADLDAIDLAIGYADGPDPATDAMITHHFFPTRAARGEIVPATASVEQAGAVVRAILPGFGWSAGSEYLIHSGCGRVWGGEIWDTECFRSTATLALLASLLAAIGDLRSLPTSTLAEDPEP